VAFRIYIDEAGTHGGDWLIIGALFVPDHGKLHAALCEVKDDLGYLNKNPKRKARYKETHLAEFHRQADLDVAEKWIDLFIEHSCFYRCVVLDWRIYDGSYFGGPFEPAALKKRRAYKKLAEMLLQPEFTDPREGKPIRNAELYLDRLLIMYGYDVVDELADRFTRHYAGGSPYVAKFQHTDSWRDANQCLQLCDLLTGSQYQALQPSGSQWKLGARDYLATALKPEGIKGLAVTFWSQYRQTKAHKFSKYHAWFWLPDRKAEREKRRKRRSRRRRR
jgi:hypothetical protein